MMTKILNHINRRGVFLLSLIIVMVFLFWYSNILQDTFYTIVDFLSKLALENIFLAVGLFLLTATASALISPLTNIPLIPIAVAIWGPTLATIFLLIGWVLGDILAYVIGRYFGRKVVCYFVTLERLTEWSDAVRARMTFSAALLLRLALPAELGYAFGIVRYPFMAYVGITIFAELPFAVISTYASEAVIYGDIMKFFGFMGILFVLIFVAFRMSRKNK